MCAAVRQIFTLDVDLRAAEVFRQTVRIADRGRAARAEVLDPPLSRSFRSYRLYSVRRL